jgi:hypothetical protein
MPTSTRLLSHEFANCLGRHATPPQSHEGWHARVVPTVDVPLIDQPLQKALRHDRVGQVEAGEFILVRPRRHRQMLEQPVVERPMVFEFEGADRMGDALDRIRLAVREIVGRVDAPFLAGARMLGMQDAVENGVAQIDVARTHVDLGPQHARAVGELAGTHAAEQVEVLGRAAVAIGAVAAGFRQRAAHRPHFLGRRIVDKGMAVADQVLGPVVELLEIVRCVVEVPAPIEAEPAHIALDRVDVFLLLLGRIGVVEAQVAAAAELLGDPEIEADRLGVADMEVAVGLGRKAGHDRAGAAGGEIARDDVADEIASALYRCRLDRTHARSTLFAAPPLCGRSEASRQPCNMFSRPNATVQTRRQPKPSPAPRERVRRAEPDAGEGLSRAAPSPGLR